MKNALIIFTRNPELGKCKTRLAKTIGNQNALEVYKHLLKHTAKVSKEVNADRFVFYSEAIIENDIWDKNYFNKKIQKGTDLGERMFNAFKFLLEAGYKNVVIIGSDLLDLNASLIDEAFQNLEKNDAVIGPAQDGGYYLLGLKNIHQNIFKNKDWGTSSVREATLNDLINNNIYLLKELNDIDTFDDIKQYEQLKSYYLVDAKINK